MARPKAAGNETLIELFLDMIAAERGASVNTLDAYRRDLADFSADLTVKNQTIAAADSDALRAYLGRLSKQQLAPASVLRGSCRARRQRLFSSLLSPDVVS